ncbi:MAG: ATP-dependent DNA helicase RecG, partial [Candidatus Saccharibacteria bacterium]
RLFAVIGVSTVEDLVLNFPRRYDDYSVVTKITELRPGPVTIRGQIEKITGRYVRRGMHVTEAVAREGDQSVRLVWFNQPYRAISMKPGATYFISGLFELSFQKFAIMNPSTELESDFPVNTARIVPIYRETKGLKSTQIRRVVKECLPTIRTTPETLPHWIVEKHSLMSRAAAIEAMHFPNSPTQLEEATKRLGFEEVFGLTLAALLNKHEAMSESSLQIPFVAELATEFVSHLPFTLTDDQKRTIWQLYKDMQGKHPMNRLVEGDVGSGKTVVATMASLMALEQGYQVAFMAPTELLARQHADTIYALMKPLGYESQVGLLVGSMKSSQKSAAHAAISAGQTRFIIGTHALIQEKVDMQKLGLVVIDEQHRFGVEQRKKLQAKAGHMPHVLSMTATPIPRSLALTLYGELDISIIGAKPVGRLPIITAITSPNSVEAMYQAADAQIEQGRQMFIVCPLVNDSEAMIGTKSAEEVYKKMSQGRFKHRRVGLLHGQMKGADKAKIMEDFVAHTYDILVATTVIEVGVDVPNATVMIIENADRFGLAQLHQLRGRVGRSSHQGYCYPVLSDSKAPSRRLKAFERNNDGFKLAELDLELRGPGAIYGTFQHGQLDLRVAKLSNTKLIAQARQSSQEFIESGESLVQYSYLAERVTKLRAVTNLN